MQKAKKYDWKDSNLALFGSDLEKNVKKESARGEPAWKNAGTSVSVRVWRIVKFKVTDWPVEDYGKFYDGDSYIVLNTYKKPGSDELLYDVHFWIGKNSSQLRCYDGSNVMLYHDEYGTAAYKTVELDTFLNDKPIQHREVQGYESALFKSYFSAITYLKGGADSGFRKVGPKEYKPRLFHIRGTRKNVIVKQVGLRKANLTRSDVFILDTGTQIFQWNGGECNKDEKYKATQYLQQLKSERAGKATVTVLEDGGESEMLSYLNDKPMKMQDETDSSGINKVLFKLSDASGSLKFTEVKTGHITKGDFDRNDVFVFDTAQELFVWVGSAASIDERNRGFEYAHTYLMKTDHPFIPVSVIGEGKTSSAFDTAVAA